MKVDIKGSRERGGWRGERAHAADHGEYGREWVVGCGVERDMEDWRRIDEAMDRFVVVRSFHGGKISKESANKSG